MRHDPYYKARRAITTHAAGNLDQLLVDAYAPIMILPSSHRPSVKKPSQPMRMARLNGEWCNSNVGMSKPIRVAYQIVYDNDGHDSLAVQSLAS